MQLLIRFSFAFSMCASAARLKPSIVRTALGEPLPKLACDWRGPSSTGVRLRFTLDTPPKDLESCRFSCKMAKFQGFAKRFVDAFTSDFVSDTTRCKCFINDAAKHLFSYRASHGHCTPDMCWEVYVKHADLGAKTPERIGRLDNYVTDCQPCKDADCQQIHIKPIGFSADQKAIIFNAADSGDTEAQHIKEVIEEYDLEIGEVSDVDLDIQVSQLSIQEENTDETILSDDENHSDASNTSSKDKLKIADPLPGWQAHDIVGEESGSECNRTSDDEDIPEDGQIGDRCILKSLARYPLIFHTWVSSTSTCGKVQALSAVNNHSISHSSEDFEEVQLRCYLPGGENGERPEVGGEGVCAIPKRKACGKLPCPCRPGSHCVRHQSDAPILHGSLGFASTRFECTEVDLG